MAGRSLSRSHSRSDGRRDDRRRHSRSDRRARSPSRSRSRSSYRRNGNSRSYQRRPRSRSRSRSASRSVSPRRRHSSNYNERKSRKSPVRRERRSRSISSRSASSSSSSSSSRSASRSRTPPRKKRTDEQEKEKVVEVKEKQVVEEAKKRKELDLTPSRKMEMKSENNAATMPSTLPSKKVEHRSVSRSKTPPRKNREHREEQKTPPRQMKDSREKQRRSASSTSSRSSASRSRTPPRKPSRRPEMDETPPRKRKKGNTSRKKKSPSPASSSASRSSSLSSSSSRSRTPPRKKVKRTEEETPPKKKIEKQRNTPDRKTDSKEGKKQDDATVRPHNVLIDDLAQAGRTGGVYIPPFKLAQLRKAAGLTEDKSSPEYQRQTWDALRKSLNGLINKVNVSNIANIIPELFQENLVRGRGLLARSIMKAQLASPGFTHIYAALVAVINTKMPENGELIVKRVVHRFRRSFKRGDKVVAIALVRFIAHLVNQQVVHELLALEVMTLLLANPTDDSVEVAVNFTKECGQILQELCPEGLRAIFERFRGILHEGEIDKRVQYTIEGLFAIRKGGFADYPAIHEQLDLVESGDQITHETTLEEEIDREDKLDVFRVDPDYEKNEQMWAAIKKEILGESDSDSDDESGSSGNDDDESDTEEQGAIVQDNSVPIQDFTEQDLVNLRRTIYLTIMSSISHEECAHKLMKLSIRPGQEKEICSMLIECCSQERTYLRYYGLLGQRFCLIKREYQDAFDECFAEQYSLIHRLETNKLRNVAKFFAHLLFSDALPWTVFEYIRLNEEETTSSSRIFIKILCQELSEHLGLKKLKERFTDEIMQETFGGLFPKDNPRNTRFAINFFTSIGLGGLTTELREHLKNAPKLIMAQSKAEDNESSDSDSDSESSSDDSSSGSSSGSSSSDSDSSDTSSSSSDSDSD